MPYRSSIAYRHELTYRNAYSSNLVPLSFTLALEDGAFKSDSTVDTGPLVWALALSDAPWGVAYEVDGLTLTPTFATSTAQSDSSPEADLLLLSLALQEAGWAEAAFSTLTALIAERIVTVDLEGSV